MILERRHRQHKNKAGNKAKQARKQAKCEDKAGKKAGKMWDMEQSKAGNTKTRQATSVPRDK